MRNIVAEKVARSTFESDDSDDGSDEEQAEQAKDPVNDEIKVEWTKEG